MANSTWSSVCPWQTIRKCWFLSPSPTARARGERQRLRQLVVCSHSVLYKSNIDHRRGYVLPAVNFVTLGGGQSEVLPVFTSSPACRQSHTWAKRFLPFPVLESKGSEPVACGSNMPCQRVTKEERSFWKKNATSVEIPLIHVRVFADANIGSKTASLVIKQESEAILSMYELYWAFF